MSANVTTLEEPRFSKTGMKIMYVAVACTLFLVWSFAGNPSKEAKLPVKVEEPKAPPTKAELDRAAKAVSALAVVARKALVEQHERLALKNGMDAHVSATGAGNKIYTFEFILMSRPFVYQLVNEHDLLKNLRNLGFTKANFTDGRGSTWSYDLASK